jgi:hypothetical protein
MLHQPIFENRFLKKIFRNRNLKISMVQFNLLSDIDSFVFFPEYNIPEYLNYSLLKKDWKVFPIYYKRLNYVQLNIHLTNYYFKFSDIKFETHTVN